MSNAGQDTKRESLRPAAFVLGGLSFIPLLGVPFGIAAIIWGATTRKIGGRKLMFLGVGGIGCCTVLLYGALFYFGFVQRGGVYDMLRGRLAQSTLTSLVPAIEVYKIQHGEYPPSLDDLRKSLPKNSFLFTFDPSEVRLGGQKSFFYERVGNNHYYLRSVGPDDKPFTEDDLLPEVDPASANKLGLLLRRQ